MERPLVMLMYCYQQQICWEFYTTNIGYQMSIFIEENIIFLFAQIKFLIKSLSDHM